MDGNTIQIISIFASSVVTLTVCLINKEFQEFREMHTKDIGDIKLLLSEAKAEDQNHISIMTERIDTLSDRVEKHNNVMEKVYELQTLAVKIGEIQKRADERIDYMEKKIEKLEAV